jgi:hypothetical protein
MFISEREKEMRQGGCKLQRVINEGKAGKMKISHAYIERENFPPSHFLGIAYKFLCSGK